MLESLCIFGYSPLFAAVTMLGVQEISRKGRAD